MPKNVIKYLKQTNKPTIPLKTLNLPKINLTILGKRGYGKTTFAKAVINAVKGRKIILVWDTQSEYNGDYIFTDIDDFINFGIDNGLDKKVYVFRFNYDADYIKLFDIASGLNNVYVVIEEASNFSKPSYIEEDFSSIVNYGRHRNINYLAIARRAAEIHKHIIAQSHYTVSFRQSLPIDIKTLQEFGFSEEIRNLQTFEYEMIEI